MLDHTHNMRIINDFSIEKKCMFIKVYDKCVIIKYRQDPTRLQKNLKIIRWYDRYIDYCCRKNEAFRQTTGLSNLY